MARRRASTVHFGRDQGLLTTAADLEHQQSTSTSSIEETAADSPVPESRRTATPEMPTTPLSEQRRASMAGSLVASPQLRKRTKPALDAGKRKPSPTARMQQVLQALVQLLDREYNHVYNHNLGVQSGTNVIEDVLVRLLPDCVPPKQRMHTNEIPE